MPCVTFDGGAGLFPKVDQSVTIQLSSAEYEEGFLRKIQLKNMSVVE